MNNETTEYVSAGGNLSRKVTSSAGTSAGEQYYVTNHLGSTMLMIDGDGVDIVAAYDYFPYGKSYREYIGGSEKKETHTFTGKELDKYDEDVSVNGDGEGLYYFGKRYLDADIGRWVSVDPVPQSWDKYSYCDGNPINRIDPDGGVYTGSDADLDAIFQYVKGGPGSIQAAFDVVQADKKFVVQVTSEGGGDYFDPKGRGGDLGLHPASVQEEILHSYLYRSKLDIRSESRYTAPRRLLGEELAIDTYMKGRRYTRETSDGSVSDFDTHKKELKHIGIITRISYYRTLRQLKRDLGTY